MAKKLDEATKLLIDSLPENLQKLAMNAVDIGYMSRMEFTAATDADDDVLDGFNGKQLFNTVFQMAQCVHLADQSSMVLVPSLVT